MTLLNREQSLEHTTSPTTNATRQTNVHNTTNNTTHTPGLHSSSASPASPTSSPTPPTSISKIGDGCRRWMLEMDVSLHLPRCLRVSRLPLYPPSRNSALRSPPQHCCPQDIPCRSPACEGGPILVRAPGADVQTTLGGRLILEIHLLVPLELRRHGVQSCFEHGVSLKH